MASQVPRPRGRNRIVQGAWGRRDYGDVGRDDFRCRLAAETWGDSAGPTMRRSPSWGCPGPTAGGPRTTPRRPVRHRVAVNVASEAAPSRPTPFPRAALPRVFRSTGPCIRSDRSRTATCLPPFRTDWTAPTGKSTASTTTKYVLKASPTELEKHFVGKASFEPLTLRADQLHIKADGASNSMSAATSPGPCLPAAALTCRGRSSTFGPAAHTVPAKRRPTPVSRRPVRAEPYAPEWARRSRLGGRSRDVSSPS